MTRPVQLTIRVLLGIVLTLPAAHAHEMRPGYLEIRELDSGTYDVLWKVPARGADMRLGLNLRLADDVEVLSGPVSGFSGGAHVQRMRISRPGGLSDTTLAVDGLERTFTDVLLRLERRDGTELTHRLTPDAPSYRIEAEPGPGQVSWTYLLLGVEHILGGYDHLLFVLALLLIVSSWRSLLLTITSFTLAHSITLAFATLGVTHVPGPPVEAVIALSIVFVATEVLRGLRGRQGLSGRRPWLVAFAFGLLHGFGFAGALTEIGLPQSSIALALLTFNLGIEIGQLCFVAALMLPWWVLRRPARHAPRWLHVAGAYAIGSTAAFWTVERVVRFWA